MRITTQQPIFLPWPGFFSKAIQSDCMVLLDEVQFPLGRSWMSRNRLKSEQGELWLTVPVYRKGRGLQIIRRVEIYSENRWCEKHLRSIRQNYAHAPYFEQYFPQVDSIYGKKHRELIWLNLNLIRFFWKVLSIKTKLVLQSELGVVGRGTDLLLHICKHLHAKTYVTFPVARRHLDTTKMKKEGIIISFIKYQPPIYPQLWGDFIYNLSTLDMIFNCGSKSREIIVKASS